MAGDSDYSKYDLARLQAELEQEREMKWVCVKSVYYLQTVLEEEFTNFE